MTFQNFNAGFEVRVSVLHAVLGWTHKYNAYEYIATVCASKC